MTGCLVRLALSALAILFAAAPPLAAQEIEQPRHLSINTGILHFETATGTLAPMVAFRGTSPLGNSLLLELALLAARPEDGDHNRTTLIVPESQIQVFLPVARVTPYLGLGAGAVFDRNGNGAGHRETYLSLSASLGVKGWFSSRLGGQAEFRGRGVSVDMDRSSSEYSIGLIWQI
jgi:hypothetical protein